MYGTGITQGSQKVNPFKRKGINAKKGTDKPKGERKFKGFNPVVKRDFNQEIQKAFF